jgi:surface protein
VSNLASIYGPTTPYSLASNLTFSQVSSGNLVVVLPDTAGSIIISDNCGCPPVATLFPSPTPTNTPTTTPTKTKTATPTPTRTLTPTITNTKTPTPTITKTPAGIDCNDCYYYNVTISQDDLNNAINNQGSTAQFNNKVCLFNFRTCNVPSLNVNYVYDTAGTYQILGLGTQNIASIFYYNNAQPVVGQSFFTRTVKYCTPTPTPTLTQTPTRTPTLTPTRVVCPTPPIGRPFISVWRTTTPNEIIELPYDPNGFYDGTINWGDGTSSINSYANRRHTYSLPGQYRIFVTGRVIGFGFAFNFTNAPKIIRIEQWGDSLRLSNYGFQFAKCSNLTFTHTDNLSLSCVTDMRNMFEGCSSMINFYGIENWDVSKVTNMSTMFWGATRFNQNLNNWDVSNVRDMSFMFLSATTYNQPLNSWNVSKVNNMSGLLKFAYNFNQPLNNWNVSAVTEMYGVFESATNINQPLNNWNVSSVQRMDNMFRFATSFNQSLNNWNVSNVTNMRAMFDGATSFNQDISSWNPINVALFEEFMSRKTSLNYSSSFYNALLNSWSNTQLRNNVTIDFGAIKYTLAGLPGRVTLTNNFGWTITDGGLSI